jgi:hypothetical protein
MTGLVLAMLRARRGQALTMTLLAAVAVAAAVAGPAFVAAADRSVIAVEVGHARNAELTLEAQEGLDLTSSRDRSFEHSVPALLSGPGFTPVFAAEFDAYLTGPAHSYTARLAFREGVCPHLIIVAGRCFLGTNEVVLGQSEAARLGVHIGQTVREQEVVPTPDGPAAVGPTATLTVVGTFRVPDPDGRYWADQHYFAGDAPVFTGRGTLEALSHVRERQSVDALLDPASLTPRRLSALRAELVALRTRATHGQVRLGTATDALLDRVAADRAALREVVPLAAVSLVLLAWLGLLLAAGHAVDARRTELGLLRLRGTAEWSRWWLGLGEAGLAILAGAPLGYLAGYGLVALAVGAMLPGAGPVGPSWQPLRWAAVAVLGALLAIVAAQRRTLAAPVTDLLRQVSARGAAWRGPAAEAVLYPLAVAAVVQLRAGSGRLTGVALLAPALVVVAVALLASRLAGPVIARLGTRSLRRGRLAAALAALRLARRPGTHRLLAVLVVAVAQLCFAVGASDVAARARDERVAVELGAHRVLSVRPGGRVRLLHAVRAADPDGRYAMAVAIVPKQNAADPPMLAVDSTRLARVAVWQPEYGRLSATQVAARLRPPAPDPVVLRGDAIGVELTARRLDPEAPLRLFVDLVPLEGAPTEVVPLGDLVAGRHRYASPVVCRDGCRLAGLEVTKPSGGSFDASVVLHALYQGDPAVAVPVDLVHSGHWRAPVPEEGGTAPVLTPGPDGLAVDMHDAGSGLDGRFLPVDVAFPLPVVSAGRPVRDQLGALDGTVQPVAPAGTVAILPRLGTFGAVVDLEYADRAARDSGTAIDPQVWLTADAPPGLTDRLRQAGLSIADDQSDSDRVRYLSRQGPGSGLRFHLIAAVLAIAVALAGLTSIAVVDRPGTRHLMALRVQGVPGRVLSAAFRRGYLGMAVAALVLGPVAAAAAWLATGGRIPLFADGVRILAPPAWPRWPVPAIAWAATGLLLLGAALVAAALTRQRDRDGTGA